MSGTKRPGMKVATSIERKCVRIGGNVPPVPTLSIGQTRQFGLKVITNEGKTWWKKHTEARYFSDVCIDKDNLAWEFLGILRQI